MTEGTWFPNENAKADKTCACPGIYSPTYGPHHLEGCPFRLGALVCDIPTEQDVAVEVILDAVDDYGMRVVNTSGREGDERMIILAPFGEAVIEAIRTELTAARKAGRVEGLEQGCNALHWIKSRVAATEDQRRAVLEWDEKLHAAIRQAKTPPTKSRDEDLRATRLSKLDIEIAYAEDFLPPHYATAESAWEDLQNNLDAMKEERATLAKIVRELAEESTNG